MVEVTSSFSFIRLEVLREDRRKDPESVLGPDMTRKAVCRVHSSAMSAFSWAFKLNIGEIKRLT